MKLTGTIVRRRSMGKYLAFADVLLKTADNGDDCNGVVGGEDNENGTAATERLVVQVVFRRASHSWNDPCSGGGDGGSEGEKMTPKMEPFPTKNSSLPYGATVELDVALSSSATKMPLEKSSLSLSPSSEEGAAATPSSSSSSPKKPLEAMSWSVLWNPSEVARETASGGRSCHHRDRCTVGNDKDDNDRAIAGEGAVSCSTYLRVRKEAHLCIPEPLRCDIGPSTAAVDIAGHCRRSKERQTFYRPSQRTSTSSGGSVHGDAKAKALRSQIFASWLLQTFGQATLVRDGDDGTAGVLDIAGGKGQLSVELSVSNPNVRCTVIDPLVRKRGDLQRQRSQSRDDGSGSAEARLLGLSPKDRKRLDKVGANVPRHVAAPFTKDFYCHDDSQSSSRNQYSDLVRNASCLIGLHPDECTEDILDAALRHGKPVAIVPCCVFPTLFPHRRLRNGTTPVNTYDDFLDYLLEKDDRLVRGTLPFEGRNQVIYFIGQRG